MKLSDVLKAKNPLSGETTSLTDVGGIWQMVVGVVLILFTFSMGQNLATWLSGRSKYVDTQPEPIFRSPVATSNDIVV